MRHHLTARNSMFSTFSWGGGPATARLTAFQTAVLCVVKNYFEIKETNRVAKIFVLLFWNETYLSFLLSLDLLLLLLLFLMSAPSVGEGGSLFNFVCCCWPLDLSFLPPSPDTFHLNMLLLLLVSRQFIFCFPSNIFSRCRHGGHMLPARAPAGNCGPRA